MDASLDTDIVIHLYKSEKKELLYSSFDKVYIYDFLLEKEMKRKSTSVYEEFKKDVEAGIVKVITNKDLIDMGIKKLFEDYKENNKYLFDQGELQAVALAKAMGIAAFVSDDTKDFGPHQSLVKELIEGVIPFAFYELLFLKYLSSEITLQELDRSFEQVNQSSMSQFPMSFRRKLSEVLKRFSAKYITERDKKWILEYCDKREINLNDKMLKLRDYLKAI
ncbi:hypothetical protein [Clostridium sp. D43t1_170807_H7]|uniref:hypothetical protein n=1 Tax=Clostridium sp. D43t1_170807_H7 TaxID=2787140 RepID=UPI00189A6A02|nr:hypothetical protein [Clostridium sp. D43t1_170807_H7]